MTHTNYIRIILICTITLQLKTKQISSYSIQFKATWCKLSMTKQLQLSMHAVVEKIFRRKLCLILGLYSVNIYVRPKTLSLIKDRRLQIWRNGMTSWLSSSTVGTQDFRSVSQETASNERRVTPIANEAFAVPVTLIKWYELRASQSGDWLHTPTALLGKQVSKAVSAVRLLISWRELLTSQDFVAVGTREALTMPRGILVSDSTLVDYPVAFHAALSILLFIARNADNFLVTWYETLVSNWLQADLTTEALFVPLFSLVLILLHSSAKESAAAVATSREVVVMTISAIELLVLTSERMIH